MEHAPRPINDAVDLANAIRTSGERGDSVATPFRVERTLAKWDDEITVDPETGEETRRERNPQTEPPTEVMTAVFWFHPDGSEITDEAEIARQEAAHQAAQAAGEPEV